MQVRYSVTLQKGERLKLTFILSYYHSCFSLCAVVNCHHSNPVCLFHHSLIYPIPSEHRESLEPVLGWFAELFFFFFVWDSYYFPSVTLTQMIDSSWLQYMPVLMYSLWHDLLALVITLQVFTSTCKWHEPLSNYCFLFILHFPFIFTARKGRFGTGPVKRKKIFPGLRMKSQPIFQARNSSPLMYLL